MNLRQKATILAALRLWKQTVSDDPRIDQKLEDIATNCGEFEPLNIDEITTLADEINSGEFAAIEVPTYYGDRQTEFPDKKEFDGPNAKVTMKEEYGLRVYLQAEGVERDDCPDFVVERQPGRWALMIHPIANCDAAGALYINDDGTSIVEPEHAWVNGTPPIKLIGA